MIQTTHQGRWGRYEAAKRESQIQLAADYLAASQRHERRVREAWDRLTKEERDAMLAIDAEQREAA